MFFLFPETDINAGGGDHVVPKERDPKRAEAEKIWIESSGKIDLVEIASKLGVSAGTVRGWKSKDKWEGKLNGTLQSRERNVPKNTERSNPSQARPGNRNAVGHGAPKGNKNAKGNRGGHGGPPGNKKAVKTGEYETIWLDALDEDEQELLAGIDTDPVIQADEAIALFSIRERRMLLRIQQLSAGLTEKQRRVLQELRTTKDAIQVHDEVTGKTKTVAVEKENMVVAQIEETSFRVIEDILRVEEALTRVQDKKLKAIELKNKLVAEDEEKLVRTEILRIQLQQLQGGAGATQSWTDALKQIAERRKAKLTEEATVTADE